MNSCLSDFFNMFVSLVIIWNSGKFPSNLWWLNDKSEKKKTSYGQSGYISSARQNSSYNATQITCKL